MATSRGIAVSTAEAVVFTPTDPLVHADPYAHYQLLLEHAPVHRLVPGQVVVARYADVASVQGDARFGNALDPPRTSDPNRRQLHRFLSDSMLFRDGEDHRRLRLLVTRAFTPRAVHELEERIAHIVDELLDELIDRGSGDFIGDFALPLPVTVICELLGIPREDRARCRDAAEAIGLSLDPVHTEQSVTRILDGVATMRAYADEIVARRRRRPGNDLISELVKVEADGDRLAHDELLDVISLLFGAGHDTTVNLLGNGMLALLTHPAQLARLRSRPDLMTNAVEEMLRYDSPVQLHGRRAREDVEIKGFPIRAGEQTILLIGAANHDPRRFDKPDRFDVTRSDPRPLSFGGGQHYCLGALLARTEARIAFGGVLDRLRTIELDAEGPRRGHRFTLRGLDRLPVAVMPH